MNKAREGTSCLTKTAVKARRRRAKAVDYSLAKSDVTSASDYYSKAVGKALDILECFSDSETNLSLTEIATLSGIPESTLFRILLTLEHHRYLQRNEDGSFRLAPKVLFGTISEFAEKVRQLVHPLLRQLNQRFDETISLAFLYEDQIRVIDVLEAIQDVRATNVLGKLLPPHGSSMAKAITAFQSKDRIDRIIQVYGLPRFTERTIVDRLALLDEYEKIRQQGWSRDREESAPGICCFGAPLLNEKQHAIAAISVMCPLIRITPEREEEIVRELVKASQEASTLLGQPPRFA